MKPFILFFARMRFFVVLWSSAFFLATSCTTAEKSARRGDNFLALGEYAEAAGQYKKAYQLTPLKDKQRRAELAYKMAECYRHYGYTSRALGSYRSAERLHLTDTLTYFYIAEMLRQQGDYKASARAYEEFLANHADYELAKLGLEACTLAPAMKKQGSLYTVKLEPLFSSTRADYCPAFLDEEGSQIFFTSTRRSAIGDELSGITGQKAGDIFYCKKNELGVWLRPEPAEGINTVFDEGACTFSSDGKTMYLTVCRTDPQYPRMAEIWTSNRADASWSKPQILKITSDTLSSYAHPAPSADGKFLYFVSDMPGGFGGTDIWRAQIGSHGVVTVENLGPSINTPGNEAFPTLRPNGELYFSSNGRGGMGGLDIYKAIEDTLNHTWSVSHLPSPINSNGDDFGMTFEGLHHRGYFASNRSTGGRGWDKIYSFTHPEVLQTVKGWVYELDGYELPSAQVYMVGNDGTNVRIGVKADGSFEREVIPGVSYVFLASDKEHLSVQNHFTADANASETHQYVLQFPLPSINIPVLVRGINYEFDSAALTDSSKIALDRLVRMLNDNPQVVIELAAHTDHRGSNIYNQRLSERRAKSVVSHLVSQGIPESRLVAKGYGESQPFIVNKKLTETYSFLHTGDTLTTEFIARLDTTKQEICHALNRRTAFRVLRNH